MAKYIHLFQTDQEFEDAYFGEEYLEPWVSYTVESDNIGMNKRIFIPADEILMK